VHFSTHHVIKYTDHNRKN